ncbi:carbon-nitrogen hydrolase family protein [Brevibacillus humidisoli]|uniref:carbon-nitrogen hydrolase family protein n=1 Tax=Brevibacillus humidisoli TaxID=2895522 RepID=UPI001E2D150E|nr:carbon-nitrogen hydrolase family protein [Brevibacillus humidisoli]UFJ39902.1 carbon-nitrogen hydrolase family protein [Brevibacillus humidisoli]
MSQPVQIAIVQSSFESGRVTQNIDKMIDNVKYGHQAYPNARLFLFPELAVTGYDLSPAVRNNAIDRESPVFSPLQEAARSHSLYLGFGYPERGDGGAVYNSFILLGPDGTIAAHYRKIHLTPLEKGLFTPGDEPVVAETKLGKIGIMICWDLAFPELARKLALSGAELILAPSAWEVPHHLPFQRFAMARAIDNTVYVASCNHVGRSAELEFFGLSAVHGPDGNPVAQAKNGTEDLLVVTIDLDYPQQLRGAFFTMREERRTDLYK